MLVSLSKNKKLTEKIIREFYTKLNWEQLSKSNRLSDDLIRDFHHKINWNEYFYHHSASFSVMKKYISRTNYTNTIFFRVSHLEPIQREKIQEILNLKYLFGKPKLV
jgi:predicted methyltransferase